MSRARALGFFSFCATCASCAALAQNAAPIAIDACSLLQRSQISQVVGVTVGGPQRKDAGLEPDGSYSSTCLWELQIGLPDAGNANAPLHGKSFVILHVMQWPTGSGLAQSFLESFREAALTGDIPGKTEPRNFGDEALWWGDGLAVRKHDVSFGLSVFVPGKRADHPGAFEERLAPYILTRLDERDATPKRGHAAG
jgi:hypothetical protein